MSDVAPEFPIIVGHEPASWCEQDVHGWFDLSYASYLTLPRSLMQEMPAEWQHRMVELLERMHEEFPEEHSGYAVFKRDRETGRFTLDRLRAYRHPDESAIAAARGERS